MEKRTLANKTREKQPHERTPIQRAAPVQNTVYLENVTQPHRAPFAAHTRPSTSTAPVDTVVPNAGAHAIGRRSQADGLAVPTSSHFTTFNIASPFVQIATLPSIDIPSRAETPETRIQPATEASVANSEPMTLHWHIEEEEDAALGYQRLKCAPTSTNAEVPRTVPDSATLVNDRIEVPPPAPAGDTNTRKGHETGFNDDNLGVTVAVGSTTRSVLDSPMHPRSTRKRPSKQAAARPAFNRSGSQSTASPRRKRKAEPAVDENAPSPRKSDARARPSTVTSHAGPDMGPDAAVDDLVKPTPPLSDKPLTRKRASRRLLGRSESRAEEVFAMDLSEDVEMHAAETAPAPELAHTSLEPTAEGSTTAPPASKTPKRRARPTSKRTTSKSAKSVAVKRDGKKSVTELRVESAKAGENAGDAGLREPGNDGEAHRKRPRLEEVDENLRDSRVSPVAAVTDGEADAEMQEDFVQQGHAQGISRLCDADFATPPYGHQRSRPEDTAESCSAVDSAQGEADVEMVYAQTKAGDLEGCARDAVDGVGESPPSVDANEGLDSNKVRETDGIATLAKDTGGLAPPLRPIQSEDPGKEDLPDAGDTSTDSITTPPIANGGGKRTATLHSHCTPESASEPPQTHVESDERSAGSEMDAAFETMLSGGPLTKEQLAALDMHIFGTWDIPTSGDTSSLALEARLPDLAQPDWNMEGFFRDSARCVLGLEDCPTDSRAHTTTPANQSDLIPSIDLDMLDLEAHLLPLAEHEASPADPTVGTELGLGLEFSGTTLAPLPSDANDFNVSVANHADGWLETGRLDIVLVELSVPRMQTAGALPGLGLASGNGSGSLQLALDTGRPNEVRTPTRASTPVGCGDASGSPPQGGVLCSDEQVARESSPLVSTVAGPMHKLASLSPNPVPRPFPMLEDTPPVSSLTSSVSEETATASSYMLPTAASAARRSPDDLPTPTSSTSTLLAVSAESISSVAPIDVTNTLDISNAPLPTPSSIILGPRIQPIPLPSPVASPPPLQQPATSPDSASQPDRGAELDMNASAETVISPSLSAESEAAWSLMFRELKEAKKAVPVKRRTGVLRRYEEERERGWDESQLQEHCMGGASVELDCKEKWEVDSGELKQNNHVDTTAIQGDLSEVERPDDARPICPEVIVIDDSDDEEARPSEHPHKCPLCPRAFKLPNGLAIHLKWHYGETSLDWKRGIGKRGRILERAKEAKEAAVARAKMLAEAQAAERSATPATTSSEAIQHNASPHKANHPCARRRCKPAATLAKEPLAMPLTPTAMFNDPLSFSASHPHEGNSGGSLRHQTAPLPPVRACSFDIDLRALMPRGASEALSTPELSPRPSRCSDGLSMECEHNQEAYRGDDLFGSENEEDELESDMSASHCVQDTMTTAMNDDDPEGAYRRVSGGGLESGLSPLAGFATLQLLH